MKKASWVIFFIAVLFAGDRLIGMYFQHVVDKSLFRYSRMYRGEGKADIVIVGNSRGLNLFQPYMEQQTGRKTFSLCYYSMPMEIAGAIAEDYLDRYKVQTVLCEVSIVEMSDDRLLSGFTTYIPDSKRIDSVLKSTVKESWISSQVSHIYRFNNEVFQRALYYQNRLDDDWFFDRTISDRAIKEADGQGVEWKVPEKHVQDLKQLADYCKARNINLKFIIGPFFPKFQVKNLDKLKKRIEEVTGIPVRDYSYAIQDVTAFSDYNHANIKGGKEVVDMMIRDGVLPAANDTHSAKK
jgi:hypothetical protein